jgi:hypothetical protein
MSWASVAPGGSTTQVQYNSSGSFAGSANITFDGTTLFVGPTGGGKSLVVGTTTGNPGAYMTLAGGVSNYNWVIGSNNLIGGELGFSQTSATGGTTQGTSASIAMMLDTSKRLLVGLTSANTGGSNFQVSQGVTFPATQSASTDANTLDDYEEGTWTAADSSGAGLAFTNTTQRYTKVGRLVTLQIDGLAYPTTSNTNSSLIGGLPFVIAGAAGSGGVTSNATSNIQLANIGGTADIRPYIIPSVFTRATNAQMSGVQLYFTFTYSV